MHVYLHCCCAGTVHAVTRGLHTTLVTRSAGWRLVQGGHSADLPARLGGRHVLTLSLLGDQSPPAQRPVPRTVTPKKELRPQCSSQRRCTLTRSRKRKDHEYLIGFVRRCFRKRKVNLSL